jgi:hypothetical protein
VRTRIIGLILLCATLLIGLVLLLDRARSPSPAVLAPAAGPDNTVDENSNETEAALPAGKTPRRTLAEHRKPARENPSHAASIAGRVLLPDDSPAKGARIEYSPSKKAPPPGGNEPALSESDGRFLLRVEHARSARGFLTASLATCADAEVPVELGKGRHVDVGDIRLVQSGSIRGEYERAGSIVLPKSWAVRATSLAALGSNLRATHESPIDPEAATFVLEELAPGPTTLALVDGGIVLFQGPTVEVVAGQVTHAAIRIPGVTPARSIFVRLVSNSPLTEISGEEDRFLPFLSLGAEKFRPRRLEDGGQLLEDPGSGSEGGYLFEDLEPGSYELVIENNRFREVRRPGLQPGESVLIHLDGSSAIALEVVSADGSTSIRDYHATLKVPGCKTWVATLPEEDGQRARFEGVVPFASGMIEVSAGGFSTAHVKVIDLQPEEVREVRVELHAGHQVEGRVVLGDGSPVPDLYLSLDAASTAPTPETESRAYETSSSRFSTLESCTTDMEGRFLFESVADGVWSIRGEGLAELSLRPEVLVDGADVTDLEITLTGYGVLLGQVRSAVSTQFNFVHLTRTDSLTEERRRGPMDDGPICSVEEDLTFHAVLQEGAYRAEVDLHPVLGEGGASTRLFGSMSAHEPLMLYFVEHHPPAASAEFQIVAGRTTEVDLDLEKLALASLSIEGQCDGMPAAGWNLLLVPIPRDDRAACFGSLDARGRSAIHCLRPGEWRLVLFHGGDRWIQPDPVVVAPSGRSSLIVDARPVGGGLQVLADDDGSPMIVEGIEWVSERYGADIPAGTLTDSTGVLHLRLQPGRYCFIHDPSATSDSDEEALQRGVWIDWTDAGPKPSTIRVRRR